MDGGGGPRWKSSVRAAGGRRSGSPVAPCVRLLVRASAGIPSGGETRFAGLTASQTPDPASRDARYRHIRPHARRVTQPSFRQRPAPPARPERALPPSQGCFARSALQHPRVVLALVPLVRRVGGVGV